MFRSRPIPSDLARYLRETAGIQESDIVLCERVSGFDRFRLKLSNGFEFFISGPVLERYNSLVEERELNE